MKKETFQDKLIKRFYGIAGPLNEYRKQEAFRLGNTHFIILIWGTMALTLLALALSKRYPEVVAYGYPTALLLSTLSFSMYMTSKMRHSQVDSLDVEELTSKEQKQLKGASFKFVLYFTAVMYIWVVVFGDWMEGLNPLNHLFDLRKFLSACLGGTFSTFLYSFAGVTLSYIVMLSAKQLGPRRVSPIGISILGGMMHNVGQLIVFATIARSFYVLNYLPILSFSGILSGFLVGLAATYLLEKVGPLRYYHQKILAEWK